MTNHYHVLVETPDANLSKGMRYLNGVYTQRFNRKHLRVGHVFQGRYKAILVEKDSYLLELARYIVLKPVRAGMMESAEQWEWSSYRITARLVSSPSLFDQEWILGCFNKNKNKKKTIKGYMQFVTDGVQQPSPWSMLKNQIYLGSGEFIEKVQNNISGKALSEIPKIQKRPVPKRLEEYELIVNGRNDVILLAYRSGGYTLDEIGQYFSLHYSTVSRIIHSGMQK